MLKKLFKKLFISKNKRVLNEISGLVKKINKIEPVLRKLSDKQLFNKTKEFKERYLISKNLNDFLTEAFAVVREASRRVYGMRHFDVQILGGIILNKCCIAEMMTGEGKTLTSTLPAYLNALSGKGVHIVTVNDYLAKRDAENNKELFEFLGLTVGVNISGLSKDKKKDAYMSDITYGTNNEFGFDYLKDNMVYNLEDKVQRKLNYALLDEVDSILIDEARTPLIISSISDVDLKIYYIIDSFVPYFVKQNKEDTANFTGNGHFFVDEKTKQINLTERGFILIENLLTKNNILKNKDSLYSSNNMILIHYMISALRAHILFVKNVDYIVKDNKILIVDEHTGRIMPGRRWSDGLHQSIEAKEKVKINQENQILSSITFQNYFRLYKKLSGMTGTAYTELYEFKEIYNLDTFVIPTNKPMIRKDYPDLVYITEKEKIKAIIKDIKKCRKRRQPVLVGTISIEKSEIISKELYKIGIPHNVLNAKFHKMEADIISQAGRPGCVTIATNMAGRGTDIVLGGNLKATEKKNLNKKNFLLKKKNWEKRHKEVLSNGGLHVIGTERHESRRIDNQLKGRSGRQGDVGSSRFYLSMEDDLMRIFTSERVFNLIKKINFKSNLGVIEHPWITKAILNAQKNIENRNFDIRKQLIEYDDIINDQRKIIYKQRNYFLKIKDAGTILENIKKDVVKKIINKFLKKKNLKKFRKYIRKYFNINISILNKEDNNLKKILYLEIIEKMNFNKEKIENIFGFDFVKDLEKKIILYSIDKVWKQHLLLMDDLREGIHLRSYAQKDPKEEYRKESFFMFEEMLNILQYEIIININNLPNNFKSKLKFFKNY
ncbi:MAG: preprotein translocase subunit SecA [Enterobacteriaceae bacterium]